MRNPRLLLVDRDKGLADQLHRLAERLRPRPEIVVCERIACFDDEIADLVPDVLIAGPTVADRSSLGRLAVVHNEFPAMSVVLAFAERPNANLREIVRTGAIDLLHLPVTDELLLETVERAIDMSRADASPGVRPADDGVPAGQAATVVTVVSPSGGSGRTMYAANAAYFLHRLTGQPTCLVDLDLEFGNAATSLRLKPRYTIADLVEKEDDGSYRAEGSIEDYLARHDTGFHLLAAPRDPADSDQVEPGDVAWVLQTLRSRFSAVVVDTPRTLNEAVLVAMDLSDAISVMATFDLPGLRNLNVYLQTLQRLKVSPDRVQVVLNKEQPDVGIDFERVAKLFPQRFATVIPLAPEVTKSINIGMPVLAFAPASLVSERLDAGLRLVAGDGHLPDEKPSGSRKTLTRLLRRRATAAAP